MKSYKVNEIFKSLQGEGMRCGTANVFLRLSGCNMKCEMQAGPRSPGGFDCDTEFESGRRIKLAELLDDVDAEWGEHSDHKAVILTGGEPAVQADKELVEALQQRGYFVAIETNGSIDVAQLGLDWITVSPKVAEHAIRQMTADEVKYVRGHGQGIPKPKCKGIDKLISPAFNGLVIDQRALAWCIDLCKDNPEWRLTAQLHKLWKAR
tara:strand:+ start:5264 stop:5887 length:624 start_codon:yes stop_codon:yes gene_type:complete